MLNTQKDISWKDKLIEGWSDEMNRPEQKEEREKIVLTLVKMNKS